MKKFNQKCCFWAEKMKGRFGRRKCEEGEQVSPLSKHCGRGVVKICKVNGDRRQCARMADLGLYPGTEAELVCHESGDHCILKIHGSNICLDRSMTENILVSAG